MSRINGIDEEAMPTHFTPDLITQKLKENEKIIHQLQGIEIQVNNRSLYLSGEKALYISNYGRIFAYDPSVRLSDKATVAKYSIEVTLNDSNVSIATNNKDSIGFQYSFLTNEFINLYSDIDINNLKILNKKDYISIDNSRFSVCKISVSEDSIIIGGTDLIESIPLKYIESLIQKNNLLLLKGCFLSKKNKKVYRDIKLFIENEDYLNACLKEYLSIEKPDTLIFSKMPFNYISFTGEIGGEYYFKEDAMISVQNDLVVLINYNTLQPLGGFKIDTMNYFQEKDKLFFTTDRLIMFLELHEESNLNLSRGKEIKADSKLNIGYDIEGHPFLVSIEDERLILRQSNKRGLESVKVYEIANVAVEEFHNGESVFIKVSVRQRNNERIELFISETYAPQLIKGVYRSSKLKQYEYSNVQRLFTSWGRQVNDILNYFYFGSLFILRDELGDILKKKPEIDSVEGKAKAANILYYAIQDQKKQLEVVSVYFPKLLEKQERELMAKVGGGVNDKPFKSLQKQLLSVSTQVRNSLADIERALDQISYILQPNIVAKGAVAVSRNSNLESIAGVGVIGEMLTGIINAPELVTAVKDFWSSYKNDKALEEIEQRKLDIYINQAFDSFEHLMEIMLPYYINEVNEFTYNIFRIINKNYSNLLSSQVVKLRLFERICALYTFKRLPVSEYMIKPKSQVIEEIHSAISLSDLFVDKALLAEEDNF